jgi:hypothetical protein
MLQRPARGSWVFAPAAPHANSFLELEAQLTSLNVPFLHNRITPILVFPSPQLYTVAVLNYRLNLKIGILLPASGEELLISEPGPVECAIFFR